ncbi:MAG: tRNA (adenosine(37)-N6)-dimethylallyltransferase MiaA [Candidatus Schekmanbacteria bacterium]|nr:MAG: tRNA (adenosine(37)-N6)-dimethylallyltransferase MiaA [Candidatus Schekmanbacteria bacterium]
MKKGKKKIIIISGPTACGKTSVAIEVAKELDGEIISADSMQVYRFLNIGTAKPDKDEIKEAKHHLIDIMNPDEIYSAGDFANDADRIINKISSKKKIPIICGGTGLYIKALTKGLAAGLPADKELKKEIHQSYLNKDLEILYNELKEVDPATAEKLSPSDKQRIKRALEVYYITGMPISKIHTKHSFSDERYDYLYFCLKRDRNELRKRIEARVDKMIEKGLYDEAKSIYKKYKGKEINAFRAIGYREMISHLKGEVSFDEAVKLIKKATKAYAKRQMTWFKKQKEIIWINIKDEDYEAPAKAIIERAKVFLKMKN